AGGARGPGAGGAGNAPPQGDASRPRPVGVNELVKYADIDVRYAAAPASWPVDSNSLKGPPRNRAQGEPHVQPPFRLGVIGELAPPILRGLPQLVVSLEQASE